MSELTVSDRLGVLLGPLAERIERALDARLGGADVPDSLLEAMRYASLEGGKRIRSALVMLSAGAVADESGWLADPEPAAVAVELVHCYSLVHDDLPAMDDDTLRRGRPTVHVRFGEAMAVLAGDALLTRAFEVLAEEVPDAGLAARLVVELAGGAGPAGMIAGQVADMGLCAVPDGMEGPKYIHTRKTAALIRAAARMGALCAGAGSEALDAITSFAEKLGLAFQLTDDLLDATGPAEVLGKTPGKDARADKRSYVAELGIDRTGRLAAELSEQACAALEVFAGRAGKLRELTGLLARRNR